MTHEDRLEKAREILTRRAQHILPDKEGVARRLANETPQTFYLGIDPTGPDIHIGHTVPLLFLEEVASLGHTIILLVGDFTARIGDPTGKDSTRVILTPEDIGENMLKYESQLRAILPTTEFRMVYNSTWLDTMTLGSVLGLTSHVTVQQMIVRDMFQERLKQEKPIAISEFLYPLLQGYDSVALRIDGEVGGNDQLFNMMMGRDLCRELIGTDKMVVATHLVVDPVSGKKMSKTEGTLIAVSDVPAEIRRKILALHDTSIETIFRLCTRKTMEDIAQTMKLDPREQKEVLARELISMYHGKDASSQEALEQLVSARGTIAVVLRLIGAAASLGEAKRLIDQGGVLINNVKVSSWDTEITPGDVIRVGKGRVYRVK